MFLIDPEKLMEQIINDKAEEVFSDALGVVEKHGVCYFRFTAQDGITIIHPRFNKQLTGVISDA
jgi:hypothetical protein